MTVTLKTHWPTNAADGSRRFVSATEIASLECWRAYRWRRAGIQPVRRFEALNFGIAWDAFIDTYTMPDTEQPGRMGDEPLTASMMLEVAIAAGLKSIDDEAKRVDGILVDRGLPRPQDWQDELDRMRTLLDGMARHYAEHYGDERAAWRTVGRQVRFEVPFPSASGEGKSNRYWLHGVIDRVMQNVHTGELRLLDDKTTAAITPDLIGNFEYDLQLPLYAWAMRELGNDVADVGLDVVAKLVPVKPTMRKTPFPVYVLDADGQPVMEPNEDGELKPVHRYEPIPCETCEGAGGHTAAVPGVCEACNGEGVQRGRPVQSVDADGVPLERPVLDEAGNPVTYKSGARKGEVKTEKVMEPGPIKQRRVVRPGLSSMLDGSGGYNYRTTYRLMREAIEENGLDERDYAHELDLLARQEYGGDADSPYFARPDLHVTDAMMDEAASILRTAAPMLDKLPDVPMRNRFRCGRCPFRVPCIERNEEARADVFALDFTTREQRKEKRERDEAEAARRAEQAAAPF